MEEQGCLKVNASRIRALFCFLGALLFTLVCFYIKEEDKSLFYLMKGLMVFFAISSFIFFKTVIFRKQLFYITPTYIQFGKFDKLFWPEIESVSIINLRNTKLISFYVKDLSKYKITFLQKSNLIIGCSPFCISLGLLNKKERNLVLSEI